MLSGMEVFKCSGWILIGEEQVSLGTSYTISENRICGMLVGHFIFLRALGENDDKQTWPSMSSFSNAAF